MVAEVCFSRGAFRWHMSNMRLRPIAAAFFGSRFGTGGTKFPYPEKPHFDSSAAEVLPNRWDFFLFRYPNRKQI